MIAATMSTRGWCVGFALLVLALAALVWPSISGCFDCDDDPDSGSDA